MLKTFADQAVIAIENVRLFKELDERTNELTRSVGELKAKPVVTGEGSIEAREMMGVTLACDHRILYGADGALFLKRIRELLTDPIGLAL